MSSPPAPRTIIKASYGQEVRRFVVQSKSFERLYSQIAEIFEISKDSFVLKFYDDEGDLCSITSDLELDYVVSNEYKIIVVDLAGSSQRAPIFSTGDASAPEAAQPVASNSGLPIPTYPIKITCGDQVCHMTARSYSYEAFYAAIARSFGMPVDSFVLQFYVRDFSSVPAC